MKDLPPEGLWISPDGERFTAVEHLIEIEHHPEIFGLSKKHIRGASIQALAVIAQSLIRDGWTRYRHFSDVYVFEVDSLKKRIELVESILADSDAFAEEDVTINQAIPRKEFSGKVKDVYDRTIGRFLQNPGRNRWRFT